MASIRLTSTTLDVIKVLLASTPDNPAWGLRICQEAGLGSGTVYPILERLLKAGWITSRREDGEHPGRPARTYYDLTGAGRINANSALEARAARYPGFLGIAPQGG
ncbi:helix-turn-helix transcriptional regulator [Streptomyces sp. NPDC005485]|uniref:PadR family transcriptional regulator n=1 Tax=Streptomyces sp. NPDC005485 TaxID=3155591 RepID=UPI0033A631B3